MQRSAAGPHLPEAVPAGTGARELRPASATLAGMGSDGGRGDHDRLRVLVVGAGLMGSQIGCEYARAGHAVAFSARDPDRARARVQRVLAEAQALGVFTPEEAAAAAGRVAVHPPARAAAEPADLVVESIPEDLELKAAVLGELAAAMPAAVLASNTSSLSITALGERVGAPERTVGTHYWNPPLLMPLVELVAGERTDAAVLNRARQALTSAGKRPVLVRRDVPGFIWNRLQLAVLREALWLVEQGVATPEEVDEVIRDGLARRSRLTGPFETAALGGVDTFKRVAANLLPELSGATDAEGLDRWTGRPAAELEALRRRRDRALAEELVRERREAAGPGR